MLIGRLLEFYTKVFWFVLAMLSFLFRRVGYYICRFEPCAFEGRVDYSGCGQGMPMCKKPMNHDPGVGTNNCQL